MNIKIKVVVLSTLLASFLVKAADFNWIVSEGGTSPIDAFQFSEASNWHEGRIPSSLGDVVYFTNLTAQTTFVKCPDDLTSGIIYGNVYNYLILMGKNLTLGASANNGCGINYKTYGQGRETFTYFDKVTCETAGGISLVIASIASKLETPILTISGGNNYHRFRYYAPHGNEIRNDEVNITDKIIQGDGSFFVEVPPTATAQTGQLKLTQDSPYVECPDNFLVKELRKALIFAGSLIRSGLSSVSRQRLVRKAAPLHLAHLIRS